MIENETTNEAKLEETDGWIEEGDGLEVGEEDGYRFYDCPVCGDGGAD